MMWPIYRFRMISLRISSYYFLKQLHQTDNFHGAVFFKIRTEWFCMDFLNGTANSELVPKFSGFFFLHVLHAALPMLTSEFRPKVAPHMLTQKFH